MKDKFIMTTSPETAELLKAENFQLLSCSGGVWTFINNGRHQFSNLEKVAFTDKLNFDNRLTD